VSAVLLESCVVAAHNVIRLFNNPKATSEAIDIPMAGCNTGDQATRDDKVISESPGGIKELIIAGENIAPREIEDFVAWQSQDS
jgi:long-subunit acyl-CoA synthetase (AMP-forming)